MSHQLDCLGQQTDDNFLLDSRLLVENAPNTVVSNSSTFPGSSNILILEQPASLVRFRYESEGLYPTQGATSTAMKKTFPTIQIANFDRLATVIVSCVTKDQPYRPHPHCLAGDDSGFDHCKQLDLESIDLDAIRLCLQVFTLTKKKFESKTEKNLADKHWKQLGVAVSEPIYNKKACTNLKILKLSHSSAFVDGGKEILMFCEKVVKDDVEIRFFEQRDQTGPVEWEALGQFHPSNVHKGFGIAFRTPPYKTLELS
ncbi:Embryonic polarity protein Dorsal 2 [Frankliniella occidentalis]|nr:Embryonic polarity protein Dorsal 2 [Frankliniella occidentalis]